MPITPTYPGVYIEELPSGVRTITGVATSITAFVGRARRGPLDEPVRVQNLGEYESVFGELWAESTMGYAVTHFFLNGGTDAIIVRVALDALTATLSASAGSGAGSALALEASSPGSWGTRLRVAVDHDVRPGEPNTTFNLTVVELDEAGTAALRREEFRNVSVDPSSPRFVGTVLEQQSALLRATGNPPTARPEPKPAANELADFTKWTAPATLANADGKELTSAQYTGDAVDKTGMQALQRADLFNLLVLPPPTRETDHDKPVWDAGAKLCEDERAVLLVDAPRSWVKTATAVDDVINNGLPLTRSSYAAVYFPRLRIPDPLAENALADFAPCGVVAGIIARTDAQRGVWKAPAGQETVTVGVRGPAVPLTDGENGQLNPLAVNCVRSFPVVGTVVWGARTWEGADQLGSQWKYLPVRRLALFIEETLYRALQWVVFEPNDEPLWAQIRLNIGAFMQDLFRQGAFQGLSPREAYLVKCDRETTTQTDIDRGIVNIIVGFAPLKPAEFVIVKIQQLAGQVTA